MTQSSRVDPVRISIACLLAWAVPGAGHIFLGRRVKGLVFLAIVLVTFITGLAFHGRVSNTPAPIPSTSERDTASAMIGGVTMEK